MLRKLYRLLTTLVTLVAVLVVAWLLLRDDIARAKDRALDSTSDARRTAELGVAGVWMWGHQILLGPLEPPKPTAAPTRQKPRRGGSASRRSDQQTSPHQVGPTPEPVVTRAARGLVRGAIDATESGRDTFFPTEWYGRPLDQRWAQYSSARWSPIRTATQYTFMVIGGLLALGSVRAAGPRRLLKAPGFLLRPLQIFLYSYFRPKLRASKTHGSARWASLRELWGMRLGCTEPQIVLGRSRIGDLLSLRWVLGIPLVQQFWHAIVVAPPGAGKTVKFIIPSILRECRPPSWRTRWQQPQRRSFIVADLKGELTKKTSRAVRETHDVKLLSFLEPHLSVRYNHIAKIRTPIQAWTFAEVWVANTGKGREEFWEELSRGMIGNAALHLAHTKRGANLLDLYELLYPRAPEQIVEVFLSSPIKPVQDGAKGLMSSMAKNEKLVGAAYADMQRRIRSIGFVSQLAATTAFDELDLKAFGKSPTALYIKFDPRRKMLLAPYVACFFTQLIDALIDQAECRASSSLQCPVMMYLDEFANIGVVPRMDDHVTTLRSYNIGFFMVVQDLAQLQDRYGETAARTIFGSAGTKICLGGVNSDDAELFSKLSGQQTVLTSSQGDNREITRVPWATGGNRGTSETGKPLIYPDELRTMGEDVFVISGSRRPIRARPKPWFRDPELRWMVPDLGKCNPMEDFRRELQVHLLALPAPRAEVVQQARRCGQLKQGGEDEPVELIEDTVTTEVRNGVEEMYEVARGVDMPTGAGADADPGSCKDETRLGTIPLSPKQCQLLLAVEAHPRATHAELAVILGWTDGNVRSRLTEVRGKLGADVGDDLVKLARERGMLAGHTAGSAVL